MQYPSLNRFTLDQHKNGAINWMIQLMTCFLCCLDLMGSDNKKWLILLYVIHLNGGHCFLYFKIRFNFNVYVYFMVSRLNPLFSRTFYLRIRSFTFEKWPKMTLFQSKMDFLSAHSSFAVQNDGTHLPRITREIWIFKI